MKSKHMIGVSENTIRAYIGHLEDVFLFSESKRYDVKGKSYFESPNKYYCGDIGKRWYDESGILHINLIDFLLDKDLL